MTRTLDDSTYATHPGQVPLSHRKLRRLRPDLYGISGSLKSALLSLLRLPPPRVYIEEQLRFGDSRAAVVVSTSPLLVAAYTSDIDCVAILRFDDAFCSEYGLQVGSRLLTVNTYGRSSWYQPDLIPGPGRASLWTAFHPIIAEFVSDDDDCIRTRKSEIDEQEWSHAYELGFQYVALRPGVARDGRPVYASKPALVLKSS